MEKFNPNDIGIANGNFFGLPYTVGQSETVLLPVTWDVTTSYASGTAKGPQAMLDASLQIDLFDEQVPQVWERKIATLPFNGEIEEMNIRGRAIAERVMESLARGENPAGLIHEVSQVNGFSERLNEYVYSTCRKYLDEGHDDFLSWNYFEGFKVTDVTHGEIGVVTGVDSSTANVLFNVRNATGQEWLIPVHEDIIESIDKDRREITFYLPDGLVNLDESEEV